MLLNGARLTSRDVVSQWALVTTNTSRHSTASSWQQTRHDSSPPTKAVAVHHLHNCLLQLHAPICHVYQNICKPCWKTELIQVQFLSTIYGGNVLLCCHKFDSFQSLFRDWLVSDVMKGRDEEEEWDVDHSHGHNAPGRHSSAPASLLSHPNNLSSLLPVCAACGISKSLHFCVLPSHMVHPWGRCLTDDACLMTYRHLSAGRMTNCDWKLWLAILMEELCGHF